MDTPRQDSQAALALLCAINDFDAPKAKSVAAQVPPGRRLNLLLMAIKKDDPTGAMVRAIAESGLDLSLVNRHGENPLIMASHLGHAAAARALIDNGADPDQTHDHRQGASHYTALMTAAAQDHAHMVQLLVNRGARVNRQDCNGRTALHWALIQHSNYPSALALLAQGADPMLVNTGGDTPLHGICGGWRQPDAIGMEVLAGLLRAGADPHRANGAGYTPWQLAERDKQDKVLAVMEAFEAQARAQALDAHTAHTPRDTRGQTRRF